MILQNIELNNTYSLLTGAQSIITKSTIAGSFLRTQTLRNYTIIIKKIPLRPWIEKRDDHSSIDGHT